MAVHNSGRVLLPCIQMRRERVAAVDSKTTIHRETARGGELRFDSSPKMRDINPSNGGIREVEQASTDQATPEGEQVSSIREISPATGSPEMITSRISQKMVAIAIRVGGLRENPTPMITVGGLEERRLCKVVADLEGRGRG